MTQVVFALLARNAFHYFSVFDKQKSRYARNAKFTAGHGASSTSTASTLALPSYSLAKRLTVGSIRLQCGHHEAKNSTISARLCASKALSKDASVTVSFVFIPTPYTAFYSIVCLGRFGACVKRLVPAATAKGTWQRAALLATTRQCSTANQEPCITKDTFC